MRNAKLWSLLIAALLLCACVIGILTTGATASDSRIPDATVVYDDSAYGETIREKLEYAAEQTWKADDVLEVTFSGTDSSAYSKPDAENGISGYTLFEVTTIFREDNTKLPIIIRGEDDDRAALIKTAQNDYSATNDYYFTNLTMNGGDGKTVRIYAGCGELVFEDVTFKNIQYTYYFGDNLAMDAYEGWDEAKVAANKNEAGLLETGIIIGNGCTGMYNTSSEGIHFAAVGYDGNEKCNGTILAQKRSQSTVEGLYSDEEVQALLEAAEEATFKPGNVIKDAIVKPWDTSAYMILDCGMVADVDDTTPDYTISGTRLGVSPVREATIELLSGGVQYLTAGDIASGTNETYVGDTKVIVRGGRSGEKTAVKGYSDAGIRLSAYAIYIGDMTLEIHEDDPDMPTYTPWIQPMNGEKNSMIYGDYYFLMTGGTIGRGEHIYNGSTQIYKHGNDGYWGAPLATGSIVNEVRGGKIWAFYGSRYANARENTTVTTTLPGTNETLTAKVTVHNKISGGEIGGLIDGKISSAKGFFGQSKSDALIASSCNEITGGTIFYFGAGNYTTSSTTGDIYNFISGTAEKYPTFHTDFYGTRNTKTTEKITNVIKGYPKFENLAGEKLSIYGGCLNGTIETIDNYLGGMPVFNDFYGGVSGSSSGKGVAYDITNTVALDMTSSTISSYVWGGNGYYQVKGVNGATEDKGHSDSIVTGSITCNIYSGHFGTFRAESAVGKIDNVPIVTNIYGGKWTSNFMPVNRTVSRTSTSAKDSTVTTNIYGGEFSHTYMGGQNSNNRAFINNIYGGTFSGYYFGGGTGWAKTITNNVYGGTFTSMFYGGGGGYDTKKETFSGCGSEAITNNIYGGQFSNSQDYMGARQNPTDAANICADQVITNNLYGGHFGNGWVYMSNRDGTTGDVINHFYSGADNPCRDPENALYKYYNEATMKEAGPCFNDQVMCGGGYNESCVDTNYAKSITNTFEGGCWNTTEGAGANITIHGGMRWGVVENVTNNFISGNYYRVYGGSDYGYVTGTITNNFGKTLATGEEAPALSFTGFVYGGGYDYSSGSVYISGKIAAAKAVAEADRTATQTAWVNIGATYGDDYEGGAEAIVNTVNYGLFHQFSGGSYGSKDATTKAISKIGSITNTINGGVFEQVGSDNIAFAGGCRRNAVIEEGITNTINGGVFNANYYGGSFGTGAVSCPSIVNVFNGGEGCQTTNKIFYLGNGAPTYNGTVKTTINDFTAHMSYVFGGSTNTHNQPEGVEFGIDTVINGGSFIGFWGMGGGTAATYNGNVRTTINGGNFYGYDSSEHMRNSVAGGARNGVLNGDIALIINGGNFTADVVGGTIWGDKTVASMVIDGDVDVKIYGGEFREDIYPVCRVADAITVTGDVSLTIEQTAGKKLVLGGEAMIDTFVANGENIDIDAETDLKIANLTGKLVVNQTAGWQAHDYLRLPAGSQYEIIESEGVYGTYTADDTILVKGGAVTVLGATLRLEERVGIRVILDKASVDAIGAEFTYKATVDGTVYAEGTFADLEEYEGNYSFIIEGIGLKQFEAQIAIGGDFLATEIKTNVVALATMAQGTWTDANWKAYAEALLELNAVYNNDEANTLTPAAVNTQCSAQLGNAADIASATATLLMGDAVGLRLNVSFVNAPANAKILVNGEEVNSGLIQVEDKNLDADLYIAHANLADTFVVSVVSDAGEHMSYTFSIEAMAAQLAADENNEFKNNATALLCYIQAAVACK